MSFLTRSNLAAQSALGGLQEATRLYADSTLRLSTGLRINTPADDPAGFVFSTRLKTRLKSLEQVQTYNQASRSLVQTAGDGIDQIVDLLQEMRTLAVSSANSTLTTADRTANQTQFTSLRNQITSVATTTLFNAKSLLNGSYKSGVSTLKFQVGTDNGNVITLNIRSLQASALGLNSLAVSTQTTANAALSRIDSVISTVTTEAANTGVTDERLEKVGTFLGLQIENHENAIGAVADADLAEETVNLAMASILRQTSAAALAQANLMPQSVLSAILPTTG